MNAIKRLFVLTIIPIVLQSCGGGTKKDDPSFIRVGITSGPEKEVAEAAKKVAEEKYNLNVELVTFNDYVVPNEALSSKDIDVNVFQHEPYLKEQSDKRGYKLVVVGKTFVYPIVGYSKKIKNIDELKPGNTIAIPNDPTNGGRSLLLLQRYGLLKLKESVGLLPRVTDIIENPKNLKILEIEAPQLSRILDDKEVVVAVINNNFAAQAGLDANQYGIMKEDKESPYVNVIVAREDNKDQEKVKNFVKAYQSKEVEEAAEKAFKGGAVKGW